MAEEKRSRLIVNVFCLNNALVKQKNRRMAAYNLTSIQADVLMYVVGHYKTQEVNQLDIQSVFKLTNPTVSGIVDRLEEKEFIKRVRSERDARYRSLVPLPKGEELYEVLRHSAREAEEFFVKDMTPQEAAEFERLLKIATKTVLEE